MLPVHYRISRKYFLLQVRPIIYVFHSDLGITMTINELWHSGNAHAWNQALERYVRFVKPADAELIRELEPLKVKRFEN